MNFGSLGIQWQRNKKQSITQSWWKRTLISDWRRYVLKREQYRVFLVFISTKVNTPNWSTYIFEILPLAVLYPPLPPHPTSHRTIYLVCSSAFVYLFNDYVRYVITQSRIIKLIEIIVSQQMLARFKSINIFRVRAFIEYVMLPSGLNIFFCINVINFL
jgi:hypothetical protein